MTAAMKSVPDILRSEIEKIAANAYMTVGSHQERTFWKAIYHGCKIK